MVHEAYHALQEALEKNDLHKNPQFSKKILPNGRENKKEFAEEKPFLTKYAKNNADEWLAEAYRISRDARDSFDDTPEIAAAGGIRAYGMAQASDAMKIFDELPNEIEKHLAKKQDRPWQYVEGKKPIVQSSSSLTALSNGLERLKFNPKNFSTWERTTQQLLPRTRELLLYFGQEASPAIKAKIGDKPTLAALFAMNKEAQANVARTAKILNETDAIKLLHPDYLPALDRLGGGIESYKVHHVLCSNDTPPQIKESLLDPRTMESFSKLSSQTQGNIVKMTINKSLDDKDISTLLNPSFLGKISKESQDYTTSILAAQTVPPSVKQFFLQPKTLQAFDNKPKNDRHAFSKNLIAGKITENNALHLLEGLTQTPSPSRKSSSPTSQQRVPMPEEKGGRSR